MGKGKYFSAKRLTGIAILLALVIVLQLVGGYFKIGATSFSFVLVPIVLGGVLYGVWAGAFLGFVFGFITLMFGVTGADPFTSILLQQQPFWTILLCLMKGTASGLISALVYKAIAKKNEYVALFVASALAPVVNTGLFIVAMLCLFKETLLANFVSQGMTIYYFLFIGCAGINFLVELAINLVSAPLVYRVIRVVGDKKRRY